MPSAIGGVLRGSLTTLPATADRSSRLTGATHHRRCHPPLPVPPTAPGATHPIRPTSRMCGFLGSGGSPDTGCRRIACPVPPTFVGATHHRRCHPPHTVPSTIFGQRAEGMSVWCLARNSPHLPYVWILTTVRSVTRGAIHHIRPTSRMRFLPVEFVSVRIQHRVEPIRLLGCRRDACLAWGLFIAPAARV